MKHYLELLQLEEKKFSLRKRSLLFHVAYFCIVIFLFISIWSSGSFGADNNFSVAFHGLALYLSRLLRFVWVRVVLLIFIKDKPVRKI
jgi:hypothetical protein